MEAVPFEEAEGARRGDTPHCTCLLPGCVVQTSLDDERSNTGSAMTMVDGDPVQPPGGCPITVRHWLWVDRSDADLLAVAARLQPSTADWVHVATLYRRRGRYGVAAAHLRKGVRLHPDDLEARLLLALVRGDANCDGSINSVDATLVLQEVAGMIGEVKGGALADVNLDGARNSVDSALILQLDAGLIDCFGRCTYY